MILGAGHRLDRPSTRMFINPPVHQIFIGHFFVPDIRLDLEVADDIRSPARG